MGPSELAVYDALCAQARHVAHSLGNALAGLTLTLEVLAEPRQRGPTAAQIGRCLNATNKLAALQKTLSLLGAPATTSRSTIDVAALFAAAQTGIPPHERPPTSCDVAPAASVVTGNAPLLQLALQALYSNAAIACGRAGRISLGAKPSGTSTALMVSDDGPGIPPAVARKLFREPCPRDGASSGTGLLVAATVVAKHHGGTIALLPDAGKRGATFVVTLPPRH